MPSRKTNPLKSSLSKPGVLSVLTLAAISAIGLGSCTERATPPKTTTKEQLKIVTTTLPITDFTKAVAGNRAEVTYLLPTNVGPHDYQAKPEDVRTLTQTDVLVENGLGLEEYLNELVTNANNKTLKIIDTSKGIETIANTAEEQATENTEAGNHDHEGEDNPHIWLDPQRAIEQVENIRDGLIAADPGGKDIYTANAAAYVDQLKALDAEIAEALKPYTGKEFVTYHDFAPYFAQRYKLKAEYLVGVPEENPSPGDVKRVIYAVKASQLKTLLTEPQAANNPFEALAKDLKVKVSYFDPMETSGAEGIKPNYYIIVMRQNLRNLETAFGAHTVQSGLPLRVSTKPVGR